MASTPYFSLRVTPSERLEWVISVSKKVAKKAVIRNLIKRRIRAVLKKLKVAVSPAKYLIVVKTGSQELKGEVLRAELATLLKKS